MSQVCHLYKLRLCTIFNVVLLDSSRKTTCYDTLLLSVPSVEVYPGKLSSFTFVYAFKFFCLFWWRRTWPNWNNAQVNRQPLKFVTNWQNSQHRGVNIPNRSNLLCLYHRANKSKRVWKEWRQRLLAGQSCWADSYKVGSACVFFLLLFLVNRFMPHSSLWRRRTSLSICSSQHQGRAPWMPELLSTTVQRH